MDTFQISTTLDHNKTHEPACRTRQESYDSMTSSAAVKQLCSDHRFQNREVHDHSESEIKSFQQPVPHGQTPCMKQPATLANAY